VGELRQTLFQRLLVDDLWPKLQTGFWDSYIPIRKVYRPPLLRIKIAAERMAGYGSD